MIGQLSMMDVINTPFPTSLPRPTLTTSYLSSKIILLDVKGCSNAVIEFSSANDFKSPYYGLNLGADLNAVSKLYKVSDSATSETTAFQSVLDCLQFKTFWIEWEKQLNLQLINILVMYYIMEVYLFLFE
jgi:hypothetical protein